MSRPRRKTMNPIFVSHGAPDLALHASDAADFMKHYGLGPETPKAILVVSAHYTHHEPTLSVDAQPDMIYDFGGFDPALRRIVYAAPGAPDLAADVASLLEKAGIKARLEQGRGYDHGTWVPLVLMRPQADIPVVQLSVNPEAGPQWHYEIGRALQPLTEQGVLIIGSGAATHNLRELFGNQYPLDAPAPDWVKEFGDWLDERIVAGDTDALLNYRSTAPHAQRNHPTEEHLLPLYVALGAAGEKAKGARIHTSHQYGVLMMDAYAFHA